jgi:hypothetical protein
VEFAELVHSDSSSELQKLFTEVEVSDEQLDLLLAELEKRTMDSALTDAFSSLTGCNAFTGNRLVGTVPPDRFPDWHWLH